jgi:Holliday junction DNA helicase RuvA
MISHIRGILSERKLDSVVVDAAGVGYIIAVPLSTSEKLPAEGREVKLFVVESVAMYGGSTALYGFLSREERDMYLLLKDEVPGAGARKALDYLDKVSKSLPDFRRSITTKDISTLTGVFGFSKKTAEKLVVALKDKIGALSITGVEKWTVPQVSSPAAEAIAGLIALGYKENFARDAVAKAAGPDEQATVEEILRRSLRYL